ncbi:MAG: recombinase family protein [Erysipelotrichaceae bacterium]|nr:recombinase family protein [Erysipelotrichaceae bacterium]
MENIAIYCRVSSQEQVRTGYSLNDQENRIRAYLTAVKDNGTYNVQVFRDEGISAKNMNRSSMKRMLDKINKKEINAVYVLSLSRFTRNVSDLCSIIDLFNSKNIEFVSITENIDTSSAHGRFFVYLLGCLAQLEREEVAERTFRGLEESAREGNYPRGGKPPFGYNRVNKRLVINQEDAEAVKQIFQTIADKDESVASLQLKMQKEKTGGRIWASDSVYKLIENPIYYGKLEYRGIIIENHSPAIISKELWEAANANINYHVRRTRASYIFKDYIYCSDCGHKMVGRSTRKKSSQRRYLYYHCYYCRKDVSEMKLLQMVDDDLSEEYKENEFKKIKDKMARNHKRYTSLISNVNYAMLKGMVDRDFYNERVKKHTDSSNKIIAMLEKEYNRIRKAKFSEIEHSCQRNFLSENVSEIGYSFKNKKVNIKWKDE